MAAKHHPPPPPPRRTPDEAPPPQARGGQRDGAKAFNRKLEESLHPRKADAKPKCTVDFCDSDAKTQGLCPKHYDHARGPRTYIEMMKLAREEGPACIAKLAELRDNPKSTPLVQLNACNSLLDRGYGKSLTPFFATTSGALDTLVGTSTAALGSADPNPTALIRAVHGEKE